MDRGEQGEKDDGADGEDKDENAARDTTQPMTPEELFKMRTEIMPQLQYVHHVSVGGAHAN